MIDSLRAIDQSSLRFAGVSFRIACDSLGTVGEGQDSHIASSLCGEACFDKGQDFSMVIRHFSFARSTLASLRMGLFVSACFHSVRKSL